MPHALRDDPPKSAAPSGNAVPRAALGWSGAAVLSAIVLHVGLVTYSAMMHAPMMDELAHLPSGVSHWRFGDFALYRVNPPLVRMVAALPVLLVGAETDWTAAYRGIGARPEFEVGNDFVRANGERSFRLFTLARWALLPLSVLGAWICFCWARDLYGEGAGLTALVLWCSCPNVLTHAAMITPDAGATALGFAANYAFWRWLRQPTSRRVLLAGALLGLAELAKTTWLVLFAVWPALWIFWRTARTSAAGTAALQATTAPKAAEGGALRPSARQLAVILLMGLYFINAAYGFQGSMLPLGRYRFVSRTLSGRHDPRGMRRPGNRFLGTFWTRVPVPLPVDYVLGIDSQRSDFEIGGSSYLRGEWRDHGWWYWYLYALAIKVPLGTWALAAMAAALRFFVRGYGSRWRDEIVLASPAAAVLVLVSSQTGFTTYLRYVLPALPFLFVWAGGAARFLHRRLLRPPVFGALVWAIGSSLWFYPHSMSYFNELAGGPAHGHEHLLSGNLDWGQDLFHLKQWLDDHGEAKPFYLAYFGRIDPRLAGIKSRLPPRGDVVEGDLNAVASAPKGLAPGWYAISVNLLRGHCCPIPDDEGRWTHLDRPYYTYFQSFAPTMRVGYSIYIYHLTSAELSALKTTTKARRPCEPAASSSAAAPSSPPSPA